MSLGTIFGALVGIGLILLAIFEESHGKPFGTALLMYWHLGGLSIVVGGTLASTYICYEARYVNLAVKAAFAIYTAPAISRTLIKGEVGRIIRWGYVMQKSGAPGLESEAKKLKNLDKFLSFGLDCVIAGYSGEEVRHILETAVETTYSRNIVPANILKVMGGIGPAFGMVGTLLGMVMMMGSMGGDASALGSSLSTALTATLYGVLSARLLWFPAAEKIKQRQEIIKFRNNLVSEGLALLAEKKSPRFIQDRMNAFLDPAIHFNLDKDIK